MQLNTLFKQRKTINCIRLSPKITQRKLAVSEFSRLEVSDDFRVFVKFSQTTEELIVEANSNLHDYINVSYTGSSLYIGRFKSLPLRGKEVANIYITTKPFNNFKISNDSCVVVNSTINSLQADISLSGDSSFTSKVDVKNLTMALKGDSIADMEGKVGLLTAKLSGDSRLENYKLKVDRLDAKLSGDSKARVTVTDTINLTAKGDSILYAMGNANLDSNNSSSGSFVRK